MSEYKGIRGFTVQTVSTDPAASGIEGGTWASGGAINTARTWSGGSGSQTAGIIFSGAVNPPSTKTGATETYDGSTWTEVADMNSARSQIAPSVSAPNTATIAAGGEFSPNVDTGIV
jgi:hypothetical protein